MELSTATRWEERGGSVLPAGAVRAVLKLAREAAEIHDPREEQAHMLGGICAIVGADVGVVFEFAGVGGVPTQYVKTIYRAYGVTSRAELLATHHGAR